MGVIWAIVLITALFWAAKIWKKLSDQTKWGIVFISAMVIFNALSCIKRASEESLPDALYGPGTSEKWAKEDEEKAKNSHKEKP